VRENRGGKLYSLVYGMASSGYPDPIEKKPLYHFHPGSTVMSFSTVGCNLRCLHCQNYHISQAAPDRYSTRYIPPEEVVSTTLSSGSAGVAWTYNEPTIWYEYTYDASRLVKDAGLYTVYVTNGYINPEPLRRIAPYLDAMNIDVKSGRDGFYPKVCGARRPPVLETCRLARELGLFTELTYLIIPTLNDSQEELHEYCSWVKSTLGPDVPLHFSRFHPDYKLDHLPPTPMKTLESAYRIAQEVGLEYVYLGNVPHGDYENTYCPECGELLIERYGFSAEVKGLTGNRCSACGREINVVV